MAEHTVLEWLSDFRSLGPPELHSFATSIFGNHELIQALFTVIEEKKYHQDLLEPVCHQLFSFYRCQEEALHRFTLQFVPTLIGFYLIAASRSEHQKYRCVEVLLLGIYNLEVVDSEGKTVVWTYRMPSTSKPSIYHEPFSFLHSTLTENALSRLELGDNRVINCGPFCEVERINASNRLQVMAVLVQVYNRQISLMSKDSHQSLCRMCSRVVRQGTNRQRTSLGLEMSTCSNLPHGSPRIPISSQFLLEMLHAVYFSMFNGLNSLGNATLEDIHYRATLEIMADVLLVSGAIRNSLRTNPSGQPSDGPMGISVALSPTTSTTTVSKAIITNASFRTKKLPDDIPIQGTKDDNLSSDKLLSAISEETEDDPSPKNGQKSRNSVSNPASSKLTVLQLRKDKTKDKRGTPETKAKTEFGLKSALKMKTSDPKEKYTPKVENGVNGKSDLVIETVNMSKCDVNFSKDPPSYDSLNLQSSAFSLNSFVVNHVDDASACIKSDSKQQTIV